MRKKMRKLCCIMLATMMCVTMSVPVMAASAKYNAAVAAYQKYLKSNSGNTWLADIDGNGVPELIMHNTTTHANEVHTYNTKTKKRKCLVRKDYGRGYDSPIKYSRSKHTVLVTQADTGGYTTYIYKVKGAKATRVAKAEYINGRFARFSTQYRQGYKINGKSVTKKTFNNKIKSLMKKSKTLKPTMGY